MSRPPPAATSGPFGAGGRSPVAARLHFWGVLPPVFCAFAKARAERLSLTGFMRCDGAEAVAVVAGPDALVGAFEMACCIGPDAAVVEGWRREALDPSADLSAYGMVELTA